MEMRVTSNQLVERYEDASSRSQKQHGDVRRKVPLNTREPGLPGQSVRTQVTPATAYRRAGGLSA